MIPQSGGVAHFRSAENPFAIRWTGRMSLEPVTAAYSLHSAAVLRNGGGLHLYVTSPAESLTPLPAIPPDARWIASGQGGAFVAGRRVLAVTAEGAREVAAAGDVLWAAPAADDRVVALVEMEQGPALAVWEPDETDPSVTRAAGTRGPAVLTGWGRQVVTLSDDGKRLTPWAVPGLEPGEEYEMRDSSAALATSPSHHRVFVASADRARLSVIDRYDWRERETSRVSESITTLRSGMTGSRLLGFDGSQSWSFKAGESDGEALPGDWRDDLPVALPGGGVLVSLGDGVGFLPDDLAGELVMVDGPADAWWLPYRWGPRLPATSAAAVEDTGGAEQEAIEAVADSANPAPGQIGLLTIGTTGERSNGLFPDDGASDPAARDASAAAPRAGPRGLPAGYYAVAISSRQLSSLVRLRQSLVSSGYSTQVLRRVDEADDIWYRLLVGPYSSRTAAEVIARELRRERGIDAWIHEQIEEPGVARGGRR